MFDIFYIGTKPNLFVHEQPVSSIEQAQELSRTRYCWVINYLLDYSDFDFLWEPVPWQSKYTHVWPSNFHEFSGTFLVPKTGAIEYYFHTETIYTKDRPNEFVSLVEPAVFDTAWAPHPLDPPYIYVFGNQWHSAQKMPTVEYHAPGATERKYLDWPVAQLKPCRDNWEILETINEEAWDWSWQPDPGDPAYIYVFGNQWHPPEFKASVEYHVPGATERKYMDRRTQRLPNYGNNWRVLLNLRHPTLAWCRISGPFVF